MNLTTEQLKRQTCETFTDWTLAPDDKKPKVEKSYNNGRTWTLSPNPIWRSMIHYRLAPSPIAAGHNPDKLTEEQVQANRDTLIKPICLAVAVTCAEWQERPARLLDKDEIKKRDVARDEIELWCSDMKFYGKAFGDTESCTYRTRLTREELAVLDKPAWTLGRSVNGHTLGDGQEWHRDDFTVADLPAPYRPLLTGEPRQPCDECCSSNQPLGTSDVWIICYNSPAVENKPTAKWRKHRTTRPLPTVAKKPEHPSFANIVIPISIP